MRNVSLVVKGRHALVAPLLAVALAAPGAGAEPVAQVPPGSVVRWSGEGIESCVMEERSWAPLDGACFYAVDLLCGEGSVDLVRTRGGQRESVSVRVGAYHYPVQKLTLPKEKVDLSPESLARVRRESRE